MAKSLCEMDIKEVFECFLPLLYILALKEDNATITIYMYL